MLKTVEISFNRGYDEALKGGVRVEPYWQTLRRIITDRQLKVGDVAHDAGLSEGYLYTILRGEVAEPSYKKMVKLASVLGIPATLITGTSQPETEGQSEGDLLRALAARFGGKHGDPEILEALLKAFAKLSPEEQQYQLDVMEWSAERRARLKVKASRRVSEEPMEYDPEREEEEVN
jgi:transcriptional regulator with XRE-family HTH domain